MGRRRARRGLVIRGAGAVLGALVAGALVVSMQLPLLHPPSTASVATAPWSIHAAPALAWPATGEAALAVPSLGVLMTHHDHVVPIASLTKMMTAYVTLQHLPLALGQTGPCYVVTSADVATYGVMAHEDESSAAVVAGESLCEVQLLEGLLIHSAGNYAVILAEHVATSPTQFVTLMNNTAAQLGLRATHYADVSGFSSQSVSSASDQARLAALLMRSPVVRSIVIQSSVDLPVAGVVTTFTPFVGVGHVIGVKSGRTSAAGGCDVLAMTFREGRNVRVLYAVVLGQRGGDLLGPAGDAALALAQSGVANRIQHVIARGSVVAEVGWSGHRTAAVAARRAVVTWWAANGRPKFVVRWRHFTHVIRRGEVVGTVRVEGVTTVRVPLVATTTVAPASLWQRLR